MSLTPDEKLELSNFLADAIAKDSHYWPHRRSDMVGIASGSVLNLLKGRQHPLAKKIKSRETLVELARELGFVIRAYQGGRGLKGSGLWETIGLPEAPNTSNDD